MSIGARPVFAYRRRASPLHAARGTVAAAYGAALATAALLSEHPLVLGALLGTVLLAGAGAGVGEQLLAALRRSAVPLIVLSVLVNVIVNRQGLTVFARLGDWGVLGQVNLTVEALVYGLVFALRLLVVALACMLVVCAADPDQLLGACGRLSPRAALSAALALRMVPLLAQDAGRLAEAQRCRPDAAGRAPLGRARLAILRATVAGALERSLDVAAVLEMRGYGSRRRRAPRGVRRSRHDLAFAAAAIAIVIASVSAALGGAEAFEAYPRLSVPLGGTAVALALVLPALALAPFLDRSGIEP